MSDEKKAKEMYDTFGLDYQNSRKNKKTERLYNDYYELPSMIKAVGDIKNKKLIDLGCGAGVHIKKYLKKGAKCTGIDISETMLIQAKQNCPDVEFTIGSMSKLPYKNSSFDIATASLSIHYQKNLNSVIREVSRALKKGGLFYYSTESPTSTNREIYEFDNYRIAAVGKIKVKDKNGKTKEQISLGNGNKDSFVDFEMLPGMTVRNYRYSLQTHLQTLRKNGFELIDVIDCKPTATFKKYDPKDYEFLNKMPLFNIYVAQKKC